MSRRPFADRLALARRLIARGASRPPSHLADQLAAANAEARALHDRIGATLPVVAPDRAWYHRTDSEPSDEVRAYLLAYVLGCTGALCIHLRRGGPRPAFCRLPPRRVDCGRCIHTLRRSVTAEGECDICGAVEVDELQPFAVQRGPLLMAGDICGGCAEALGIRVAEVAS